MPSCLLPRECIVSKSQATGTTDVKYLFLCAIGANDRRTSFCSSRLIVAGTTFASRNHRACAAAVGALRPQAPLYWSNNTPSAMANLGDDLLEIVNRLQDLVFNTIGNDSLDLPQIVWNALFSLTNRTCFIMLMGANRL